MRSFASKIDANSVASAQVGGYTPNPNLTFAELVRGYCLCAKPNEPRDYRLQKWLEWLGDSIAWDITEEQIDGLLEALSNAGMATSTVDVARNGRTYAARVSAANALSTGPMASLL